MSIATEIQRLQQAKADLKTAIVAKGVEVSDTDTIDTYASKIDSIQSGDSWYDTFWDAYQYNGGRTVCDYIFAGRGWTDVTFDPKYSISPTIATSMFMRSQITDLDGILKRNGVTLDFSKSTDVSSCFYNCAVTKLGVMDLSSVNVRTRVSNTFRTSTLQSIEKLVLPKENIQCDSSMFADATSLTHVIFEGTIYQNFTINASTLDIESAKSVLLALKNYAGTANEFTYKIVLSAGTWAVLDADGTTSPNGNTWREYVNDIGWNVG